MKQLLPPLTADQVVKLKKENPGAKLTISDLVTPEQTGLGTLTVVWKTPTYDDWERYQAAIGKDGVVPIMELLASVLVHPAELSPEQDEALIGVPMSVDRFIEQEIMPFFGRGTVVRSRAL